MWPENVGSMKTTHFIKGIIDLLYSSFTRVNNETEIKFNTINIKA